MTNLNQTQKDEKSFSKQRGRGLKDHLGNKESVINGMKARGGWEGNGGSRC